MSKKETRLTILGRKKEWTHGIVNPPVYRASTCIFDTYQEMRDRVADPAGGKLFYGRKGTPTQWSLADAITDLEGGAGTMLYPSGVAAVNAAILACVKAGDHVLITDSAYDPTRSFADKFLRRMGVERSYYKPSCGANIEQYFRDNTTAIVTESPGSLTFEVQDIPAIVHAAKKRGIKVITDNTWATPLFFNPLEHGVDIVVHACTKYICGHSDVMIGSATANDALFPALQQTAFLLGQTTSPDDAYLTLRGLRTLDARLRQHEKAALHVAQWLDSHDMVETVLHPAFASCPGHTLWKRDFSGSTGLFSIILKAGNIEDTAALVDEMRYFKMGFSWGGYESLILPSDPRSARTAEKWTASGPLLRLHIGLEHTDDLISDLEDALDRYRKKIGT